MPKGVKGFQKGHTFGGGRELGSKNLKTLAKLKIVEDEIEKIRIVLRGKSIDSEEYRILVDALEKLIKLSQLLSGGATERVVTITFDSAFNETPSSTTGNRKK